MVIKKSLKREENKRQLLEFIKRKKEQVAATGVLDNRVLLRQEKQFYMHYFKKEHKPKEAEKVYLGDIKTRKERREKILKLFSKNPDEEKQKKLVYGSTAKKNGDDRAGQKKIRSVWKRVKTEHSDSKRKTERAKIQESRQAKREEAIRLKEQQRQQVQERAAEKQRIRQEKKERLCNYIASVKRAKNLAYQQEFLKKATLAEDKRLSAQRRKQASVVKRAEIHKERLRLKQERLQQQKEALQRERESRQAKREEAIRLKEQQRQQVQERAAEKQRIRQEKILTARLFNNREKERKVLLSGILREKHTLRKKITPISGKTKAEVEKPIIPTGKISAVPISREEIKNLKNHLDALQKEASRINAISTLQVKESVQFLKKFASAVGRKKIPAVSVSPSVQRPKQILVQQKEAFQLIPFIRKNTFKLVSLLLLFIWIVEMFLFIRGLKDASTRLKLIVGEEPYTERQKPQEKSEEPTLDIKETLLVKEKIDIEGKRDPFSPGRLTMEVLERPTPINIVLAPKPEVISILRAPKMVSILKEEKPVEPVKVASVSKPQSSVAPISVSPLPEVAKPSKTTPLEKVVVPEITPLIMPEMRCELIYRGRMIFEGVEYLFIEGRQKTYRVTIGDVVEGFRILRKDKDKLYLSKDGVTYEIKID